MQRHLAQHHGKPSFPHHGLNEKSGSPWHLKVDHKCNMTNQLLRGGGGPIECVTQWKKILKSMKRKFIKQVDNHTLALDLAQDLKHTLCKSKDKLKMMLGKNGHAIFVKYFLEFNMLLSLPTSQKGGHTSLPLS
jgi:hypothetical protein